MVRDFGSIRKAPSGMWFGRYRVGGKDRYTPRRRTKQEVKADLAEINMWLLLGDNAPTPADSHASANGPTVNELSSRWFNKLEAEQYSPNTIRSYRSMWRAYILPAFGNRTVSDVSPVDVEAFRNDLYASGRSDQTITNIIRCMSTGFTYGIELGIITTNSVRLPRRHKPPRPTHRRGRFLSPTQLDSVVANADPYWRAAIVLAGWGALRSGEVAALTRADITSDGVEVTIDKAVKRGPGGELVIGSPKSSTSYRTISLPLAVAPIIVTHLATYTPLNPTSLLYANGAGNPVRDSRLRSALHEALDAAGLPRMRFHDLRHTGLTEYGRQGATVADLMRRAGHSDPKTVMVYQHSDALRDAELANRMGT